MQKVTDVLESMTGCAKKFRVEIAESINGDKKDLPQSIIDAVLSNFINHIGYIGGRDGAIHATNVEGQITEREYKALKIIPADQRKVFIKHLKEYKLIARESLIANSGMHSASKAKIKKLSESDIERIVETFMKYYISS